jgi:Tfp pilus assembly PilM family ATPase
MAQEENTGIIGVSLVDDRLRMVEVVRDGGERHISRIAQGTARQIFNHEVFADKNLVGRFAEDINRLYKSENFSQKDIAFCLDSRMVLIKKIPVDIGLEDDEIEKQIQWEVEQFAISPVKEYIIDYEALPSEEGDKFKDMLVVVVRKKIVRFLRQLFRHTDLHLKFVDVDIFSAQRALQENYEYNNGAKVGLIDIENGNILFSILRGRGFFLSQDIHTPRNNGNDQNYDESTTRLIAKELRRLILDHQLGSGVEDLNEIFLYGDSVEDGVLEGLQNSYDVRIDRANPFKRIKLTSDVREDIEKARAERFVTCVGAALRGIQ